MSKSKAISRPFEQTAHQRAELDALRRMLDLSEGTFSLSIAICNSPALRDHIIEHVTSQTEGVEIVHVSEDVRDIFDFVRRQIPNGSPRAIFIVDLEKALGEDKRNRVLQGLNVSREQWHSTFQCPVVFWLPDYVLSFLMTQARDLWSWVSHNFEFVSDRGAPLAGLQESFAGNLSLAGSLDVHEKQFRIAELEQRIAGFAKEPKAQLMGHILLWLNELAFFHISLGELDKAEAVNKKALEIGQKLGWLEAMAVAYGNLGVIYRARGNLDEAEKTSNRALEVFQRLGDLRNIAGQHGNLGVICALRGDLDEAEKRFNKALEISRKLKWPEGMATIYGNLAALYQARGDSTAAEKMLNKAVEIDQNLGRLEGMANHYANLGLICQARGDLDEAERMFTKSLEIDQRLGRLEGVATACSNLAAICQARGDFAQARGYWTKALALFQKIGAGDRVRAIEASINDLPREAQ